MSRFCERFVFWNGYGPSCSKVCVCVCVCVSVCVCLVVCLGGEGRGGGVGSSPSPCVAPVCRRCPYLDSIALGAVQPALQVVDRHFDSRRIVPHAYMAIRTARRCQVTRIGVPRDGGDDVCRASRTLSMRPRLRYWWAAASTRTKWVSFAHCYSRSKLEGERMFLFHFTPKSNQFVARGGGRGAERERVSSRKPGGSGGMLPRKICDIWIP